MGQLVIKKGFYANGKQRWLCKTCKRSFSWDNPTGKLTKEQTWFRRWIIEGYSVRQLADQSKHSKSKLYRIIDSWLAKDPPETRENLEQRKYLIFDGTFFHRPKSLLALMDTTTNSIICGKYGISERSEKQVRAYFNKLKTKGLNPISFTVDGNAHVIQAMRKVWPGVIIQRCLIHVQRQGFMWCRANPKTIYGRDLRKIFAMVTVIHNKAERDHFLEMVAKWEVEYGPDIKSRKKSGKVFGDIKQARSMLLNALPDMFHYLDNSNISFTTNSLEGYFSRLKRHYGQHRGLPKKNLENYLAWYLFFRYI